MKIQFFRKWIWAGLIITLIFPTRVAWPHAAEAVPPDPYSVYLPLVSTPPPFEVEAAWLTNAEGLPLGTFLPAAEVQYAVSGFNRNQSDPVALTWDQSSLCGTQTYTETLSLEIGAWTHTYPAVAPACEGQNALTVQITNGVYTSSQTTYFWTKNAAVVLSEQQGFDRCNMPRIDQMQTWWDSSPYYIANIYLGGISYDNTTGCSNDNVDANWVQTVAGQGWNFLLAWVGPQAPCSGYTYKMSYDPLISYLEGQFEAELALIAASNVGLPNSIQLHYDVEGYGNASNEACRAAVASFLQGWTDRLNELGAQAGAYGSPCNSHISDWADNVPPPQDVWIAHWLHTDYNPFATVWDSPCLSNDLWPNHQRAKQYAGDHYEDWGGLLLRVDSNVLDGGVVSLAPTTTITTTPRVLSLGEAHPQIQKMDLLTAEQGWVAVENRLLITRDGGFSWADATPTGIYTLLDAHFLDISNGWLVYQDDLGLGLLQTSDGGSNWQSIPLLFLEGEFTSASVLFEDASRGKLSLKLSSGNAFHLVREFFTADGGQTWLGGELISLPVETENLPVNIPMSKAVLPDGVVAVDWGDGSAAWALVQQGTCQGDKFPLWQTPPPNAEPWVCAQQSQLWATTDGALTWMEITPEFLITPFRSFLFPARYRRVGQAA